MITSKSATQHGPVWSFSATSSLSGPTFYWYVDGLFFESSTDGTFTYAPAADDLVDVDVVDSDDEDFDPEDPENAPRPSTPRRSLTWIRSLSGDVSEYKIEQKKEAGDYSEIGRPKEAGEWCYSFRTERLDDLSNYTWRITPVDTAGTEGTPIVVGPEWVVRRPDPPAFEIEFNAGAATITISEAAA